VDADVAGFFDNLDHALLLKIIERRVNDGAILRLIGKWLKAGVMEARKCGVQRKWGGQPLTRDNRKEAAYKASILQVFSKSPVLSQGLTPIPAIPGGIPTTRQTDLRNGSENHGMPETACEGYRFSRTQDNSARRQGHEGPDHRPFGASHGSPSRADRAGETTPPTGPREWLRTGLSPFRP
jgi:hypothetical protein